MGGGEGGGGGGCLRGIGKKDGAGEEPINGEMQGVGRKGKTMFRIKSPESKRNKYEVEEIIL